MLLSFLTAGLGHIYCGRFGKGLVLFFLYAILGVPGLLGMLPLALGYRLIGISATIAGFAIWIYAIFDARRIAKRASSNYVLKDYNRWWVYLILILIPFPISVAGALHIRAGIIEAFYVPSKSMYPTIHYNEKILANKVVYDSQPVRRGDIVVFVNPNKRHQFNVKRIVALAGDTVEIKGNRLLINGRKLEADKIDDYGNGDAGEIFLETNSSAKYQIFLASVEDSQSAGNFPETIVPNGHCFILGDNRNKSEDSRDFGPVPLSDIVGRVDYIYYPRWVDIRKEHKE